MVCQLADLLKVWQESKTSEPTEQRKKESLAWVEHLRKKKKWMAVCIYLEVAV